MGIKRMKKKKGKVQQSKKAQKVAGRPQEPKECMSLLEEVKLEKELWKQGNARPRAKEAFRLWLSLPAIFLGAPEQVISKLGIEEQDATDIMRIGTQRAFAELVGVKEPVLSEWKAEIMAESNSFALTKAFVQRLTKNMLGSLYRAALQEGDAARVKLWMQIVEGWREQMGVEHSGDIGGGLSDEERAALDKLIAKNTS